MLLAGFCGLRLINITQEEKKTPSMNLSGRSEVSKCVFDIIRSGSAAFGEKNSFILQI